MPNQTRTQLLESALKEINEIFDPLINHVALFVGRIEAAGGDPSRYFDVEENENIDYRAMLALREAAKSDAVRQIKESFDQLPTDEMPDDSAESVGFWKSVLLIAQQVLKDGIRITIGDFKWDSAKPLDGIKDALNRLKDKIIDSMGLELGSELTKLIRTPGRFVGELPDNVKREVDKALTDIRRESDRILANATKEAAKVVANSKREIDQAATNVVREIGKSLPKIKIKKPRIKW
jgi:hypothetical protein